MSKLPFFTAPEGKEYEVPRQTRHAHKLSQLVLKLNHLPRARDSDEVPEVCPG